MLGVQKCWECKIVGSSKMLGVQKCWKLKNVGRTKLLGVQKCWECKIVGRTKNVERSKLLGVQKCWESYQIVTWPFFMKLKCWYIAFLKHDLQRQTSCTTCRLRLCATASSTHLIRASNGSFGMLVILLGRHHHHLPVGTFPDGMVAVRWEDQTDPDRSGMCLQCHAVYTADALQHMQCTCSIGCSYTYTASKWQCMCSVYAVYLQPTLQIH